jgi:hypothetical protein
MTLLLEASAAQYRSALGGLERNRSFLPALRTNGSGLRANPMTAARALRLALLAALGVIRKLFVVEENLLASRENKVGAAVNAFQDSIGKFHGRLPQSRGFHRNRPLGGNDLPVPVPCFPVSVRDTQQGPGPHEKVRR